MHIVHGIGNELQRIVAELSHESLEFDVSVSSNPQQGDITTNVALIHFKKLGCNSPREAAVKIAAEYDAFEKSLGQHSSIEKIEIAGPGFVNFYLNQNYLLSVLNKDIQPALETDKSDTLIKQKKTVMVEFGDPNPFKEIHIGHLRNFCIGESFCRLLETQGVHVVRANYQGDVGMHVAKALWGIMHDSEFSIQNSELTSTALAKAYAYGATKFEEDEGAKQEIIEINKKIYQEDEELKPLWEKGRKVSLDHFEELYKRIGVAYDKYYFESTTAKKGKEIVLLNLENEVFERHEGAVVYRGEQDGLHTRVFVTSQDYATYEGKDLALAILKSQDSESDQSIVLTGNEQAEYFQVMLAALTKIRPDLAQKTQHLTFGHVRLKDGKMSSRTGDVITASWLLDESVARVKKAFSDMDPVTTEKVGVGAVKYSMLKFSVPSDIHFSFEDSISLEGNSGPYLQYTYVRTQSVINKSQIENSSELKSANYVLQTEENDLMRFLAQYEYHLENAANEFAPNLLCNYLFELAQKFNLFYQKCKIIGGDNEEFRLKLTESVGKTIQHGLKVLGIETVGKM